MELSRLLLTKPTELATGKRSQSWRRNEKRSSGVKWISNTRKWLKIICMMNFDLTFKTIIWLNNFTLYSLTRLLNAHRDRKALLVFLNAVHNTLKLICTINTFLGQILVFIKASLSTQWIYFDHKVLLFCVIKDLLLEFDQVLMRKTVVRIHQFKIIKLFYGL